MATTDLIDQPEDTDMTNLEILREKLAQELTAADYMAEEAKEMLFIAETADRFVMACQFDVDEYGVSEFIKGKDGKAGDYTGIVLDSFDNLLAASSFAAGYARAKRNAE